MQPSSTSADPVPRVYRLPGEEAGRLVLECAGRWGELEAWLAQQGAPRDMRARLEGGWLGLERLRAAAADRSLRPAAPLPETGGPPLLPPLLPREVGKILCLGKNFRAHAAEFGEVVPESPLVFAKLASCLVGSGETVSVPAWYTERYDFEAELCVVIGRAGADVPAARALELVAAYTVANDLTARTLQGRARKQGHPWLEAKNLGRALPLGPCLVPAGALDGTDLTVTAHVNDEPRQRASTADLVVTIPEALAHLSTHFGLEPGDLILMGTPEGVGPLVDGDEVRCAVSGIGELRTPIRRLAVDRRAPDPQSR